MKTIGKWILVSQIAILTGASVGSARDTLKPVRDGQIKATIKKATFQKVGDTYKWVEEKVCDIQATVPVYDFRGGHGPSEMASKTCDSKVAGVPVKVEVSGIIGLARGPMTGIELEGDFKAFGAYLSVKPASGHDEQTQKIPFLDGLAITRSLQLEDMYFMLKPHTSGISCTAKASTPNGQPAPPDEEEKCTTELPEYFTASVELMDDKQ